MKWAVKDPLLVIVLCLLILIFALFIQDARAQYLPIPNFGAGGSIIPDAPGQAGYPFRQAVNQRFGGQVPISPQLVHINFASLPSTVTNGQQYYINDGSSGAPCGGSGSGAIAIGINGQWICINAATSSATAINLAPNQSGDYNAQAFKMKNVAAPTLTGDALSEGHTIGATTPAAITGTTITANTGFVGPHNGTVGATTPAAGIFTTVAGDVNGKINPMRHGAKCDGVTDDSASFVTSLGLAAGGRLEIPPTPTGCLLNSTVTYNVTTSGGIFISGPGSAVPGILCGNTAGCLDLIGTPGTATAPTSVEHLQFKPSSGVSAQIAYGLQMYGLANVSVSDVTFMGGSHWFTYALYLVGTQKSRIRDVTSSADGIGLRTDDSTGPVGSNQNIIDNFQSIGDHVLCSDFEGGVGANQMNSESCQNSVANGIVNNQTTSSGGFLPNIWVNPEVEANAGLDFQDQQGGVQLVNGGLIGGHNALEIDAHGWANVTNVNLNGGSGNAITLNGNVSGHYSYFEGNTILTTVVDNSGYQNVWRYNQGGFAPDLYGELIGTVGSFSGNVAGSAKCIMEGKGRAKCLLTGWNATASQAWTYPIAFTSSSSQIVTISGGTCGTYNPTTSAAQLALPFNGGGMTAENCEVLIQGQ